MLTIAEKLTTIARHKKIGVGEYAERLGCTRQNLYIKLRRGTWTEEDLKRYAEALGCTYEVVFTDKETGDKL